MKWQFWKRSKLKPFKQWQIEKAELEAFEKGTPIPGLNCIRSNCGKPATHEVKSQNGYVGIGYCDKHWKDRDPSAEGALLME